MQPVLLHVAASLGGASALAALFGLAAAALAPTAWPLASLALILGTGALLSLEGMTGVRVTPVVTVLLALLAGSGAWKLAGRSPVFALRRGEARGPALIALIVLALAAVHAATPLFRADQWTYHLVVAKLVANGGRLTGPIVNDHILFAGVYEYVLLIPRLFTSNDVVIHGLADAFTWLLLTTTTVSLLRRLARTLDWPLPSRWLLASFVLFSLPTYDMITNAKPDVLTVPLALAALIAVARREPVAAGFFLMAPMAIKPTWAHFGLAGVVALLVQRPTRHELARLAGGALLGALVALPVWAENVRFFGNPLHPGQIGPFRSAYWSEAMASHWWFVASKPEGVLGYARALAELVWRAPWTERFLLLPPLAALAVTRRVDRRAARLVFPALAAFLVVWPTLYAPQTYARFVYPLAAFALILAAWGMSVLRERSWLPWLLLVPAVANGSLEVKAMQLGKALPLTIDELYASFPSPMPERNWYELINRHRRAHHPASGVREHRILSDNNSAYHYDGEVVRYTSYDYEMLVKANADLDIRYLFAWKVPFSRWPPALQPLIATGVAIEPEGRVLWLPPQGR